MRFSACLALFALSAGPVMADPAALALKFTDSFVIPHFRTVAETAKAQANTWDAYCADRSQKPDMLREAYNKVGDAWAGIEFMRMGPAAVELRADRFNYWLDRHDATGQALDALVASTDANALSPDSIAKGSIVAQGMPMMERLLYGDDALAKLGGPDGARRCEIGKAVAHNISALADAIVADWTEAGGAREAIAANKPWKTSFADAKQAASVMQTAIVGGIGTLQEKKISFMFHDVANAGAPRLAEAAHSERSLRDVEIDFAALHEAADMFAADGTAKQRKTLDHAFAEAKERLEAVDALKDNASPELRMKKLHAAIDELGELNEAAEAILPAVTGLSLGFNNLDGD
ncbi:MAG TPA: imelysin family protein [Rhizomicrobium sp.]|jgi:predicted lipoprotein|nr:imelysin family protein [Rhizomicrobium sp.]